MILRRQIKRQMTLSWLWQYGLLYVPPGELDFWLTLSFKLKQRNKV